MEIRYERQYWELVPVVSRSEEAILFWKWAETMASEVTCGIPHVGTRTAPSFVMLFCDFD